MYRLTVSKTVPNPNFEQQMKTYVDRSGYGMVPQSPDREVVDRVLEVELTDAEFAAIKKAVLGVL